MHPSVLDYCTMQVHQHRLADLDTLEVGSKNYNGSPRQCFRGAYTGVDVQPGDGVDQVANAHDLPFDGQSFDVVVTTEMLEHDDAFWLSVPEMVRVLRPGGHLILTTRGIGFPYHEYPGDYWRFTQDAIELLFTNAGLTMLDLRDDPYPGHPGVLAHAQKGAADA